MLADIEKASLFFQSVVNSADLIDKQSALIKDVLRWHYGQVNGLPLELCRQLESLYSKEVIGALRDAATP